MKITIGADHAGFELKDVIIKYLVKQGYEVNNQGTDGPSSVDYPDFAHAVSDLISSKSYDLGILVCGSGNGVCMSANKHKDIRAALCWNVNIGELARKHNDANILCLPARFISQRMAKNIVNAFLKTDFEGGRHQNRVNKISC